MVCPSGLRPGRSRVRRGRCLRGKAHRVPLTAEKKRCPHSQRRALAGLLPTLRVSSSPLRSAPSSRSCCLCPAPAHGRASMAATSPALRLGIFTSGSSRTGSSQVWTASSTCVSSASARGSFCGVSVVRTDPAVSFRRTLPDRRKWPLGPGWNGFWRGPGVGFGAPYWSPTGSRGARNPATMVTISAGLTSSVHLEPSSES